MHMYIPDICCINSILTLTEGSSVGGDRSPHSHSGKRRNFIDLLLPLLHPGLYTEENWIKSAVLNLLPQESTKTQVTPDSLYKHSGTANLWFQDIASCRTSRSADTWEPMSPQSQHLASYGTHRLINMNVTVWRHLLRNSCIWSDLCQSDH